MKVWNFLGLFVSLFFCIASTSASAHSHSARHSRHNTDLSRRESGEIEKRFFGTRWTYYLVGLGACGKWNIPTDFIVAMNAQQFGQGYPAQNCFKTITMTYNGKTAQAMVMDKCPECPFGGLDLSAGLFSFFAPTSVGVLYGTWSFDDGSGGGNFRSHN